MPNTLPMTQNEVAKLEWLIDRYTLATVVEALADICSEKADHVQTNWQDRHLAKAWERNATKLYRARSTLNPTE